MALHITDYDVSMEDIEQLCQCNYDPVPDSAILDLIARIRAAMNDQGRKICLSLRQFLERINVLSTLILDIHNLYLGWVPPPYRLVALIAVLCKLEALAKSLSLSGCAVTVRNLRTQEEVEVVHRIWPFAKRETSTYRRILYPYCDDTREI